MTPLKVLVLVHHDCVPPEEATAKMADWARWKTEYYVKKTLLKLGHKVLICPVSESIEEIQFAINAFNPDIAFNLLEEFLGDPHFESHVVAYLEMAGVPYTGCNPQGLSLGRDKATSKKILQYHAIPTPGFFTVPIGKVAQRPPHLQFPLIVKSLSEEASLGISQDSVVNNDKDLQKRVQFIHEQIETSALVEEFIEGREVYVGVLGNRNIKVFTPWELDFGDLKKSGRAIATRNVKFNKEYSERYKIKRHQARHLDLMVVKKIENLSRDIYKALKLSGYARLDYRITDRGQVYFLEANPNPELAKQECFANGAKASGLEYSSLIRKILSLALSYKRAA